MKRTASIMKYVLTVAIAGALAAPAFAEKPEWAGEGKKGNREYKEKRSQRDSREDQGGRRERGRAEVRIGGHFDEHNRVIVRDYYHEEYRRGHCPPGLAKKHNGCMPPGQARKWRLGRVLPRDVIYYDVPPALIVQLGHPPTGYRYVRVASDILMIAIGTGLVVDAIEDIGRMQ